MSENISIIARAPVIAQATSSFSERLTTENETFTITADVGFDKAGFTLRGNAEYLKSWFRSGLGRDVIWRGPEGAISWEGFVSKMTLTEGSLARSIAMPSGNRVVLVYAAIDDTVNPPETGGQAVLTLNDTVSQEQYGIIGIILSGGELTAVEAAAMAASKLDDLSRPRIDETATPGAGQPPILKVNLIGYANVLDWFNYEQTIVSGTVDASSLISTILANDPNNIISTSQVNIDSNTTQVQAYRDGKKPSWKLIQEIIDVGDGSTSRLWVAGVYEGRQLIYKQAEATNSNGIPLAANQRLAWHKNPDDPADRVIDAAGREIKPWRARPDHIIFTAGYGRLPKYVWQVTYSAPWNLQLKSADISPLTGMVRV